MNNNKNTEFDDNINVNNLEDGQVVDEVNGNVEDSTVVAEVDAVADSSNVDQEVFLDDDKSIKKKKKKDKPKMPKKKKIIIWVVSVVLVLAIIGGAIGGFFIWLGEAPSGGNLSLDKLELKPNVYYHGTANDSPKKGQAIEGAYNVTNYDDMIKHINEGHDVVLHAKEFTMTAEIGTIELRSDIYGNGLILDANAVAKAGNDAIRIPENDEVVKVYDLWITGKKDLDKNDTIKSFNDYSSMIKVVSTDPNKSAKAEIKHCILENGHKVLHVEKNADVTVEGSIIRNASDTTISVGTFANLKNKLYLKNNVIASSLTSGINVYCYDGAIDESNAANSWAEVTIDGFLDVYNWKSTKNLAFIPDSEGEYIARIANRVAGAEILPLDKNAQFKVTLDEENEYFDEKEDEHPEKNPRLVTNQYIHLAITKIATASIGRNEAVIKYVNKDVENRNELKDLELPLSTTAKMILKQGHAWGYMNNNKAQVKVHDTINTNSNIFNELINGRKY